MTPVYLDFESFWSNDHSLSRMSPLEYVTHADTEIISCGIAIGDGPVRVAWGYDGVAAALSKIDWGDAMAIGHNMSGFDSLILAWRFGITPKMWGCTLAMARSRYAKTCGLSLKTLSEELAIGRKLSLAATNMKGKRLADLTAQERVLLADYNIQDVELCRGIFKFIAPAFPKNELHHIHLTTRMLVEPQFEVDTNLLETSLEKVREEKQQSLLDLANLLETPQERAIRRFESNVSTEEWIRSMLASTPRFAKILEDRGVSVPMKPSPTNPQNTVPALAKTDEEFLELQEHEDPVVAAAVRCRLAVKSTLLETRIQAFLRAAAVCNGKLPIPLRYCGADTTGRWSGEQYNPQNLPRLNKKKPKHSDALRQSLLAPKGYKVVVADLSGIELRVNMFLWRVPYAMQLFRNNPAKADLYRYFAAHDLYNIDEAAVDEQQRQVGKVSHLGLGFGAGPPTFQRVARLMGGVDMALNEADRVVRAYRRAHPEITDGWQRFQFCIKHIYNGYSTAIDPWGLCVTETAAVRLPSGRKIHYPDLRQEGKDWVYGRGRNKAKIYAGKGVENLVQALARDIIADNCLQFYRETGFRPTLMVHDELVYIVPEAQAEEALSQLQAIMRTPPNWWPDLVTWSEGGVANRYSDAK